MKLLSEFSEVFQVDTLNVVERLSTVEASFSIVFQALPNAEVIRSLCNRVPTRDNLELTLKNDSNDIVYVTNHQTHEPDFTDLIYGMSPNDNIYIKLQIDKNVEDEKFSIYDFTSFSKDLVHRSVLEVLRWFSVLIFGKCLIMIFPSLLELWHLNQVKTLYLLPKLIETNGYMLVEIRHIFIIWTLLKFCQMISLSRGL